MSSTKLIILAAIILVLVSVGLVFAYVKILNTNTTVSESALPSPISRFSPSTQSNSSTKPQTLAEKTQLQTTVSTQPSTGDDSQNLNYAIFLKNSNNNKISNGQVITLQSNVVSQTINLDVKDSNGSVLTSNTLNGCIASAPCQLQTVLYFSKPQTQTGSIDAYTTNQNGIFVLPTQTVSF